MKETRHIFWQVLHNSPLDYEQETADWKRCANITQAMARGKVLRKGWSQSKTPHKVTGYRRTTIVNLREETIYRY